MSSAATRLSLCAFLCLLSVPTNLIAQTAPRPLIVQSVDEGQLVRLQGNTYPLARSEFDQGAAPSDLPMQRMLLVLKRSPEQDTALMKLLDDQQDKASPNYHKWLTPEQFGKQFGPADQDIQTITAWLQSHGFAVNRVTKGRSVIEFSGTASQVQEAFHTPIHKYVVNGENHWANASDPEIPAALVPAVAGVNTLHNFYKEPQISRMEKVAASIVRGPKPQVTFSNPTTHALGPQDYATIYNMNPVYQSNITGSGVTIGVVGRTNINLGDVNDFHEIFAVSTAGVSLVFDGPDPGNLGGGEEAEAVLDTTWSSVLAPGAEVKLVVSASTNTTDGVDLSEIWIIDNNLADIMTESFASCEAGHTDAEIAAQGALAEQAAAQGIAYMVSSGDAGAEGCDNPNVEQVATGPISVNYLASTPFNISVGGTIFNEGTQSSKYWSSSPPLAETALSYIPENVWNESCSTAQCGAANANIAAGGGGFSSFFTPKPSWQSGVSGIPADGTRDQPDVSLTAAFHDPYLLCLEGSCEQNFIYFISGTSASSPSFAGIMALVLDKISQEANPPASPRQGQANYVLYRLAAQETLSQCNGSSTTSAPASSCVFHDITAGNNAVPGESGYGTPGAQYAATVGYDRATGLGSVNVANLVNNWSSVAFNQTSTTIALNPTSNVPHGSAVNIDVTVTPNSGSGVPTGSVSLLAFSNGTNSTPFGVTAFELDNTGSISSTTNLLPGGTYSVAAEYGGDGNFGGSTSPQSSTITVTSEPSTTTTSVFAVDQNDNLLPLNNVPYGSAVFLRADVAGKSGFGTATGSVAFEDGNTALAPSVPLNSEGNTLTQQPIFTIPGGQHSVTASYSGDASFKSSTSSPVSVTVSPIATTASVTASSTSYPAGAEVALTAIVRATSFGNFPTGNVVFLSGTTVVGNAPLTPFSQTGSALQAQANWESNQYPAGANSITVQYAGDGNYNPSVSAPVIVDIEPDFSVSPAAPTVTISAPGGSGTLGFTVTGQAGYNGTINFTQSSCSGLPRETTCSFSPPSVSGNGTTTLTIATTAPHTALLRRFETWAFGMGFVLGGLALAGTSPRRRRLTSVLCLFVLASLFTTVSCGGSSSGGGGGGGSSDPGTPTGSTTVTITATATYPSGTLTHTTTITLDVQ